MDGNHQRKSSRVKNWLFKTRSRSPTPEPAPAREHAGSGDATAAKTEPSADGSPRGDVGAPQTESPVSAKSDPSQRDKASKTGPAPAIPQTKASHGKVPADGDQPPPYDGTNPAEGLDLWEQARGSLGEPERQLLDANTDDKGQEGGGAGLPDQLQDLVRQKQRAAEAKAWKFEFGGRRIVLREVVEKITGWLNAFKALGDIASSADPMHAGIAWAAVKVVLQVATADQEQAGQVLVAVELVTCLMNRGKIYESLYLVPHLIPTSPKYAVEAVEDLKKTLVSMYSKVLSLLAAYMRLTEKSAVMRALTAAVEPGKFSGMLTELARLEDRCELAASNCERHVASSSRYLMDANYRKLRGMLQEHMERAEAHMSRFWKKLDNDERCKIFLWISEVPYETDHYNATKGRVEGTGQWLLDHETYERWREAESSTLLWLNGIPGAGKTKLSSKVVDDVLSLVGAPEGSSDAFAYFYCDRNRTDHRDPVVVLRSLVRQLSAPSDESSIIPYIEDKYTERKRSGFSRDRLTTEECHDLLLQLTRDYSQSNIVIDGLDECDRDTRYILMDILDDVANKSTQPLKIYIASRQDQDLRDRYQTRGHLEVTANHNQSDIEKFVMNKMEQSTFCRTKMTAKVRQEVLRTFQDKSQGMFQWASLHIDELLKLNRNKDILAYLDKLPRGLEAAYHKIFGHINAQPGSKRDVAFAVFKILMCSWRSLSPEEMVIACTQLPEEDFCLDPDVDIDYVRDACHNFMIVADGLPEASAAAERQEIEDDEDAKKSNAQAANKALFTGYRLMVVEDPHAPKRTYSNSICRFAHLSIREYLELHHWSVSEANAFMASICLRTVLRLSLSDPPESEAVDDDERDFEEYPVLRVKVADAEFLRQMVWYESGERIESGHAEDEGNKQSGSAAAGTVAPPFTCFLSLCNVHAHDNESTCSSVPKETYLETLRQSALERWARYASETWSLHYRRSSGVDGPRSVLGSLLEEFLGEPHSSSLAYRAWTSFNLGGKNLTMADPEQFGRSGRGDFRRVVLRPTSNPALGCAYLGLEHMLGRRLEDGRADANATNFLGDGLLALAIEGGHYGACETLLAHGADPEVKSGNSARPLQSAASLQRLNLVELLLRHGADPNVAPAWQAEGDCGEYPLTIAVGNGHLGIVKALVDAGASSWNARALQTASEKKRYDVLEFLLKRNADPGGPDPDWSSRAALLEAWDKALWEDAGMDVLECFINCGIDIHTANSLHATARQGNVKAIRWLLKKGMDVNQKAVGTRLRQTPLMASVMGNERRESDDDGLEVLLAAGASVHDTDSNLETPVWYAVEYSRPEALRRLLRAGGSASTRDKLGLSPLLSASAKPSPALIQALLDHGADPNELHQTSEGAATPLYTAVKFHEDDLGELGCDIVSCLVAAGAKYRADDLPEPLRLRLPDPDYMERRVKIALESGPSAAAEGRSADEDGGNDADRALMGSRKPRGRRNMKNQPLKGPRARGP